MYEFWDRVSSVVIDKTGISTKEYQISLEKQKETIIDFLKFNCYPDEEIDDEIISIKKEILSVYTKDISQAISKIEVYSHDLDAEIVEAIFQLVQNVSCAELTKEIEKRKTCYNQTLYYIYFIKHMVQISLSKLILDRIKMYKRNLKNFNHKGYYIQDKPFDDIVKSLTRKAKKTYKDCLKRYLSYIKRNSEKQVFLSYTNIEKDIGLESLLNQLEEIVLLYEDNYPKIVDNGYNMPVWLRFINFTIELVSFVLLVYGFLDFFGLWNTIVNSVQNLF